MVYPPNIIISSPTIIAILTPLMTQCGRGGIPRGESLPVLIGQTSGNNVQLVSAGEEHNHSSVSYSVGSVAGVNAGDTANSEAGVNEESGANDEGRVNVGSGANDEGG